MPKTKPRVLHGNPQCEQLLDLLALKRLPKVLVRVKCRSSRRGDTPEHIDVEGLMLFAFQQFYAGTDFKPRMVKSFTLVIDVTARTITLTNVKLQHRLKHLPKVVHDLRVY
jgi:hypothetical protein